MFFLSLVSAQVLLTFVHLKVVILIYTSRYKANMSNDKAELFEKTLSVKLLVIIIIAYQRYPSTYCVMPASFFLFI